MPEVTLSNTLGSRPTWTMHVGGMGEEYESPQLHSLSAPLLPDPEQFSNLEWRAAGNFEWRRDLRSRPCRQVGGWHRSWHRMCPVSQWIPQAPSQVVGPWTHRKS